jgi:hypothetical protein
MLLAACDVDALEKKLASRPARGEGLPAYGSLRRLLVDAVVSVVEVCGNLNGVLGDVGGPPAGIAISLDEEWMNIFRVLLGRPIRLLRTLVPRVNDDASCSSS